MRVEEWTDPPKMDTGAPATVLHTGADGDLWCAYRACSFTQAAARSREEGAAVLRFDQVLHYQFGYPNDEALAAHPLYSAGVRPYSFYLIESSDWVAEFDRRNEIHRQHVKGRYIEGFKHWIATFHDDTLEVVAKSASVALPFHLGWNSRQALELALQQAKKS